MKLYDLKLKEIQVLEKKIQEEKLRLKVKPVTKPTKTQVLHAKLIKEKVQVSKKLKKVVGHHNKLLVI
jgi:hypothetical protein